MQSSENRTIIWFLGRIFSLFKSKCKKQGTLLLKPVQTFIFFAKCFSVQSGKLWQDPH